MQRLILLIAGILVLGIVAVIGFSWMRPLTVAAWMNRRALTKAGFVKTQIDSAAGKQRMFVGGKGPTIILLHGAGDQAGAWAKVAPALTSNYRVLAPDLAGHQESEPKSGPLSVGVLLQGLEGVVDGESGKVTIVGNSLGAWVAMLYAHKHPEKVERIVLVNGGAIVGDRPDLTLTPKNRDEARKLLSEIMDPGSARIPDYVVDDIVRQAQTGPLMRLSETASEMPKYLLEGRLGEIKTPVSLVWGESDKMMSVAYAKRMQQQLPIASLMLIPRCGHAPQMECPRALTEALTKVLASPVTPTQPESTTTGEAK
ncbi:MAG TPA: alpha/beta hydrolase [Terriglobales bacterium]|nr:alpha/beta hydrolase [Terriglobales bacterium]